MATQLNIDPATEQAMQELVSGGFYASPEQVIQASIRLIREREGFDANVDAGGLERGTIEAVEKALDDADAGRVRPACDVFADLRRRYPADS